MRDFNKYRIMRYKDFKLQIQEQDDLLEIRMDPTSLARAADDPGVRVGIEFEMIVPGADDDYDEPEMEPDYDYDERATNISQICDFFDDGDYNSRRDINRLRMALESDFSDWAGEQFESRWNADQTELIYEYLRDNVDFEDIAAVLGLDLETTDILTKAQLATAVDKVIEDRGDLYDQAYDNARNEFMESDDLQEEWLDNDGLHYMQDINNQYNISWPYYTTIENDNSELSIQMIADEFSGAVGKPVNVSQSYRGARREPDKYSVEPDGSIDADDGEVGLEFISPPMSLPDMLKDLTKIQKWAERMGARTNRSTGLHMNISVPGLNDNTLDYVKLALLLGDQYVLQQFGRQANTYTRSAIEKIKDSVKARTPEEVEKFLQSVKSKLNKRASELLNIQGFGKYTSINPKSGYIEFRSPGGDYLNEPTEKLVNTLRRFVVATKAAIDPDAYRQEYISKLTRLLTPPKQKADDTIEYFAKFSAGELPKSALKSFIRQAQLQRKVSSGQMGNKKMWWRVGLKSNPNYSIEVVGSNSAEAISAAMQNDMELMRYNKNTDFTTEPVRPFDSPESGSGSPAQQRETYTIYDTQDRYNIAGIQARTLEDAIQQFQQRMERYSNPERYQLRDRNGQVVYPESSTSTQSQPGGRAPMRYNNPTGRESNPQGQYVIMMSYGDPPLYRFDAANINDAREVFYQWQEANPEVANRLRYDWDPNMLFGQPPGTGQPRSFSAPRSMTLAQTDSSTSNNRLWQIVDSADGEVAYDFYLSRENNQQDANEVGMRWVRNNGDPNTSYSVREQPPSTGTIRPTQTPQANSDPILAAPESNPDANWAIVRNSDDAIIEYFTRNTPAEAETAFNRWIESLDADNNIRTNYRLEPVRPRGSASSTRTTDPSDISGWRIVLANGEEVHQGTNTGISQQEAESRAASWLYNNGYGVLSSAAGDYRVEPIRPMSRGQENTRPEPETTNWTTRNQIWRILLNGEEVHNFWNTNVQSDANAAARQWILDKIRRGLLSPEEGAEIEVVPVRS